MSEFACPACGREGPECERCKLFTGGCTACACICSARWPNAYLANAALHERTAALLSEHRAARQKRQARMDRTRMVAWSALAFGFCSELVSLAFSPWQAWTSFAVGIAIGCALHGGVRMEIVRRRDARADTSPP